MSSQPIPGGGLRAVQREQQGQHETVEELAVVSETFLQVSDRDAAAIKGGGRETTNPTSDDGCCGADVRLR